MDMIEHARTQLHAFFLPQHRVLVGVSGGCDSIVLLHILATLRNEQHFTLSAIHVHHGLSPNADTWMDFVKKICLNWNIPLIVEQVDVARNGKQGLEAAAREVRHQAFAATISKVKADYLTLAHHQDDQAETVLFRLLRGCGVHGASGMQVCKKYHEAQLIRPLLNVSRESIEAYAFEHKLTWIDDESNLDPRYTRNALRQQIFPQLKAIFPRASESLARAARHFAEADELLIELAQQDWQTCAEGDAVLRDKLIALPSAARIRNLLRYWLAQYGYLPEEARLNDLIRKCSSVYPQRIVFNDYEVWSYRKHLRCLPKLNIAPPAQNQILNWSQQTFSMPWGVGVLTGEVKQGQGVALKKILEKTLYVGSRKEGLSLSIHPLRPARSLKKLWQDNNVPAWIRSNLPCIYLGDKVLWVAGAGYQAAMLASTDEDGLVLRWECMGSVWT